MKIKAEEEVRLPRAQDHLRWPADRQMLERFSLTHCLRRDQPGRALDLGLLATRL